MQNNARIYIAGHTGLVGSALVRKLKMLGYNNLITYNPEYLDLRDQSAVNNFFSKERPEYIFLAAAKVGGIYANYSYPAEFIYDNVMIAANIIHASYLYNIKKLLFLGSSCIYPKECVQPIKEEYLLTGPLESTNESYAVAKIMGIKMCESYNKQYGTNFISCMPTNLYGPGDNFDLNSSHVIPALIAKFCKAQQENLKEVICWGTGNVLREFMHVDDAAQAAIFLMDNFSLEYSGDSIINIGSGQEVSICEVAHLIKNLVNFNGKIIFDSTWPEGVLRKRLCTDKLTSLGWKPKISLYQGIKDTIDWYKNNKLNNSELHYYSNLVV